MTRLAYGAWPSPVSPRMLAGGLRLNDVQICPNGTAALWLENRGLTSALVLQRQGDAPRELTDAEMSVRGRIGYGGGEFALSDTHVIFAGNNGRLYRQALDGGSARAITPAFGAAASPALSPDGRWTAFVHSDEGADILAVVDSEGREFPRKWYTRADFVMQPAWSPAGDRVAFIAWDRPQMPWDGAVLMLGDVRHAPDGLPALVNLRQVAGGPAVSVFGPQFSADGAHLAYASDEAGWWQVYVLSLATGAARCLTRDEAEYATPAWLQGMRTFAWAGPDHLLALRSAHAAVSLVSIAVADAAVTPVSGLEAYTDLRQISVAADGCRAALLASASAIPERVLALDLEPAQARLQVLRRTSTENLPAARLARAEPMQWTGDDGETVHGLFYRPVGEGVEGVGKPPLIVIVHGGPTSHARQSYVTEAQFYATRGYALLYVNHRGSTGYGRDYKNRGHGMWGVTDVADAASGARALAAAGVVDPERRVVLGGSAGGFTALQSLVDLPGFWTAAVSLYGIGNQFTLVSESTFKFETHYSETLLGPLPDAAAIYRARSPLFHVGRISDPLLVFQGDEDQVVPRAQSDSLVEALRARGVPVEYHVFAGEGHGWRKPETIEAYLRLTLAFLERTVVYR